MCAREEKLSFHILNSDEVHIIEKLGIINGLQYVIETRNFRLTIKVDPNSFPSYQFLNPRGEYNFFLFRKKCHCKTFFIFAYYVLV